MSEKQSGSGVIRPSVIADIAVLAVAMVWGASYPVTKDVLFAVPALVLIVYRFAATACIFWVIGLREILAAPRHDIGRGAGLGVILSAIFMAEIFGVAHTTATNAALVISLCTLFTPFLDYGLARRVPPRLVIFGAVVACAGVGLLVGRLSAWTLGDGLILLAAMLRAVMVVSTRRVTGGTSLSASGLTALQASTVCIVGLVVLAGLQALRVSGVIMPDPGSLVVHVSARVWGEMAFLVLFCTVAAFYVQNAALSRSSPTRVSFLMGTEPLFGFLLAHILLSEPANTRTFIGGAFILCGTLMGMLSERVPDSVAV